MFYVVSEIGTPLSCPIQSKALVRGPGGLMWTIWTDHYVVLSFFPSHF